MNVLKQFGLGKDEGGNKNFQRRLTGFSNFAFMKLSLSLQENSMTIKQHVWKTVDEKIFIYITH